MAEPSCRGLFLPQLIDPEPGPWTVREVTIRESAVNTKTREAFVPRALTPAQALARLHEGGHVKWSPRDWLIEAAEITKIAASKAEPVDPGVALRIAKMLEENRIDWLLWVEKGIDLRPAREVLDWSLMPVPVGDELRALEWVLQLAWTVWGSISLRPVKFPLAPPPRPYDEATYQFFLNCWRVLRLDVAQALITACSAMYQTPTPEVRNAVAAELATFFPPKVVETPVPQPKKDEARRIQEALDAEAEAEESRRKDAEVADPTTSPDGTADPRSGEVGHCEYHDHTLGIRRPSMRLARRDVPQPFGTRLAFPHRYMIDKAVFARRVLTEGSLMIDGSGSMHWTSDDLEQLLQAMPAIWVGIYAGFAYYRGDSRIVRPKGKSEQELARIIGRVCTLAKNGRFCAYERERGMTPANNVDFEGVALLARWPKPRFWLSDGIVGGGKYDSAGQDPRWARYPHKYECQSSGLLIEKINALMKQHEIYRVSTREDMLALVRRKRVVVYRSCVNRAYWEPRGRVEYYPPHLPDEPVTIQL